MYLNNFYMSFCDSERDSLLDEFQIEANNKTYRRIDYNIWRAIKSAEEIEIFIDDEGLAIEPGNVTIYDPIEDKFLFESTTDDGSLGTFLADFFNWQSSGERGFSKNNKQVTKEKEKDNMKMFGGFEFGSCEKDNIRLSPYGVAVKNANGTYVSYKADTGEVIDVDIANFDGGKYLFKMPVAFKDIKIGDVVIHNRKPHFVTEIKGGNITAVDICAAEEKRVIPVSNMFGFNFVTKVVSLFDTFMAAPSPDQPFGNMLPFFLMNEDGGSENLMLAMMLSQGGATANFNPMMLYLLANNSNDNSLLPLLLMSQGGFAQPASK